MQPAYLCNMQPANVSTIQGQADQQCSPLGMAVAGREALAALSRDTARSALLDPSALWDPSPLDSAPAVLPAVCTPHVQ